jgi:hypothetical protein
MKNAGGSRRPHNDLECMRPTARHANGRYYTASPPLVLRPAAEPQVCAGVIFFGQRWLGAKVSAVCDIQCAGVGNARLRIGDFHSARFLTICS